MYDFERILTLFINYFFLYPRKEFIYHYDALTKYTRKHTEMLCVKKQVYIHAHNKIQ